MRVRRGDVVRVELDPTRGSEQRGSARPCVVVQNDVGNRNAPTTIVAPFTKQYDPNDVYPFEVEVRSGDSPLPVDSVADLSQVRVVDIAARVKSNVGSLSDAQMRRIDAAIRVSLGL